MKLSKLFGISAIITGAVAITGKSSSISVTTVTVPGVVTEIPEVPGIVPSGIPITIADRIFVSYGAGKHCNITNFGGERYMSMNLCYETDFPVFTLRSRVLLGNGGGPLDEDKDTNTRCVLATFSDSECSSDGYILQNINFPMPDDLNNPDPDEEINGQQPCVEANIMHGAQRVPGRSVMWTCAPYISRNWTDPIGPDMAISARSVDVDKDHDRVTLAPADGFNCNSAQHRDTDTKHINRCHSFAKPFFSLRADVQRAEGYSVFGGSQPCEVLVFSDKQCTRDGASVVDLLNTTSLGVCHNVSLHHDKDVTVIPGHSWKWVCGRQDIDACLHPVVHHSEAHPSAATSTAIDRPTKTITATTSLACSITTDHAHYFDVITSLVTLKPVTHVSTSVFTKTKTHLHTKLITSVATDVSTVLHSVTKPYKTTYMVCDVRATPSA